LHTAQWSTDPGQFGALKYGAVLNLDVTVEATSGTVDVNPFYWQAKDPDGRTYTVGFVLDPQPQLQAGAVRAGDKSRGWVSIDAPQGPMTVQLVNILGGTAVASWSVG
jgi:hypothetical protein